MSKRSQFSDSRPKPCSLVEHIESTQEWTEDPSGTQDVEYIDEWHQQRSDRPGALTALPSRRLVASPTSPLSDY